MRIYKIKNYISGYLIFTALFFAVSNCRAQSFMEKGQKHLPFSEEDATRFVHPSLNTATPIMLQEQGMKIISENEFLRALLDDIVALNIEITNKKCIAKCPISGTVLSKESYLDQDERKASITFRNGFDKSDMDEKKLHKCIRKIFCKEYPNLCIILYGQGSNIIIS